MEVRDEEGKLNGIEVQRLKEKLGTRQVPTAELLLDGSKAHRVCNPIDRAPLPYSMGMAWQTHTSEIRVEGFKARGLIFQATDSD